MAMFQIAVLFTDSIYSNIMLPLHLPSASKNLYSKALLASALFVKCSHMPSMLRFFDSLRSTQKKPVKLMSDGLLFCGVESTT